MKLPLLLLAIAASYLTSVSAHTVESHAQIYWKSKLGNIPMPKVLQNSLRGVKDEIANEKPITKENLSKYITFSNEEEMKNNTNEVGNREYGKGAAKAYGTLHNINELGNREYSESVATTFGKAHSTYELGNHEYGESVATTFGKEHSTYELGNHEYGESVTSSYGKLHNELGNREYGESAVAAYGKLHSTNELDNREYSESAFTTYGKMHNTNELGNREYEQSATTTFGKLHSSNEVGNREYGESAATTYGKLNSANELGNREYGESAVTTYVKLLQDSGLVVYFLEKDLVYPGGKMKLQFTSDTETKFLPFKVAKSIPFSYSKLLEILNLLSIKPNSNGVQVMVETLKACEAKPIKGEKKYCTTSLETLVDYVISNVGRSVKVFSTTIYEYTTMLYKVEKAKKISNNINLVCHRMNYPYAVFYCHNLRNTDSYVVSLVDTNGKKSKAVAVCHKDTSSWNPGHLAFRLLKVKPGSVPICHFLEADTIIWAPASN